MTLIASWLFTCENLERIGHLLQNGATVSQELTL